MIPVTAAGGVLYQKKNTEWQVLLILRNGVWDLPKGKQEASESIKECARREVAEEVGIPPPVVEDFLTETYHEYEREGKEYAKTTHWYRMKTNVQNDFTPETREGIAKAEWTEIEEAEKKVGYENLRGVLSTLKKTLK